MPFISSSVTCNIPSSYIWSWGSTLCPEICLCCYSVAKSCATTEAHQTSLSFTIFQSSLKLRSIELVMPFNHLILCGPLLLLPSIFPSVRVFFFFFFPNESVLYIRWPKYWSFNFSISLSMEYSRLISFRLEWLDLLVVQGILKSLLQHHNFKASILCAQNSLWSNSHIHALLLEKP